MHIIRKNTCKRVQKKCPPNSNETEGVIYTTRLEPMVHKDDFLNHHNSFHQSNFKSIDLGLSKHWIISNDVLI